MLLAKFFVISFVVKLLNFTTKGSKGFTKCTRGELNQYPLLNDIEYHYQGMTGLEPIAYTEGSVKI